MRGLLRYMSESKLELMRNLSFAASGTLLANILLIAQIGIKDLPLRVSVFASAIALPIWIAHASIYEAYIFRGRSSYQHLRSNFSIRLVSTLTFAGGLGFYIAILAMVWHLDFIAASAFFVSSMVALMIAALHEDDLKKALAKKEGSDA